MGASVEGRVGSEEACGKGFGALPSRGRDRAKAKRRAEVRLLVKLNMYSDWPYIVSELALKKPADP